jgi:hypothetical protein
LIGLSLSPRRWRHQRLYWIDDGLAYAIATNAPRDLLLKVAEIVYQQNSPEGARAKIPPVPGKPS